MFVQHSGRVCIFRPCPQWPTPWQFSESQHTPCADRYRTRNLLLGSPRSPFQRMTMWKKNRSPKIYPAFRRSAHALPPAHHRLQNSTMSHLAQCLGPDVEVGFRCFRHDGNGDVVEVGFRWFRHDGNSHVIALCRCQRSSCRACFAPRIHLVIGEDVHHLFMAAVTRQSCDPFATPVQI